MKIYELIILSYISTVIGTSASGPQNTGFWSSLKAYSLGSSWSGADDTEQQNHTEKDSTAKVSATANNATTNKQFNTLSIDESEAKKWIKYAAIAYCPESSIKNWDCPQCSGNKDKLEVNYFQSKRYENSGFITVDQDQKVIVASYETVQASLSWTLKTAKKYSSLNLPKPYEDAKVHSGFYKIAQSLFQFTAFNMEKLIKDHPDFKIVITGHSMGGAIATLNAFNLVNSNITSWDKLSLITYGQPRVGNQAFADYMSTQRTIIARVNHEADPIPTIPTPPNYYHHGYALYIHLKTNTTSLCKPTDFTWDCLTSPINLKFKSHFDYWDFKLDPNCVFQ